MQLDKAKKEAMMEELKHYINAKFKELEDKLLTPFKGKEGPIEKVKREKATRG